MNHNQHNRTGLFEPLSSFTQKLEQSKQLELNLQRPIWLNGQCFYEDEFDGKLRPAIGTVFNATWSKKATAAPSQRQNLDKRESEWIVHRNRTEGASFHKLMEQHFNKEPLSHYCDRVKAYRRSVEPVLEKIGAVHLVEMVVPWRGILPYAAKLDFMGEYNGSLHVIEWTSSTQAVSELTFLGNKLEQVTAQVKAVRDFYNLEISRALIIVAHPYGDATVFTLELEYLANCWKNQLLPRIKRFYEKQMLIAS
ncbi:hypothetical protein NIES4075_42570 [Tolypothrix sp. NIES-4075]|uniref:hypothetical protein n=1 Tax=Tolypothrix sp. NIES-4075 TaxID=2005459 RepID=UPI000B5C8ECC|nr:hypothetical protein [Tolypothrix sp. NIES-4075]GAX43245.1 hypothetical protein NIES4075_42570 [Tolypothrix sp. NIES-4075]